MSNVLDVSVLGKVRRVHVERPMTNNKWAARLYVKSKTVSGVLSRNSRGALRFNPIGRHANLVRSDS